MELDFSAFPAKKSFICGSSGGQTKPHVPGALLPRRPQPNNFLDPFKRKSPGLVGEFFRHRTDPPPLKRLRNGMKAGRVTKIGPLAPPAFQFFSQRFD